jgi:predicted Zn-dependent protease
MGSVLSRTGAVFDANSDGGLGRWMRAARTARLILLSGLVLTLAGCGSDRIGTPAIPVGAPRVTGIAIGQDRERASLIAAFGGEYDAPVAKALLTEVTRRVVAASEDPSQSYRITILNSPATNAFALPSGDLFVTRGLLALANDPSEVAAVIAHEVAHVTARHALQRAELERRTAIVARVVSEVLDDRVSGDVVQARGQLSLASFSRAQELEADEIGVRTIAAAGYDPFGAARFLGALGRDAALRAIMLGEKPGQQGLNFLSTHPTTPERAAQALAVARSVPARSPVDNDRERYLAATDGIIYGDDPAEGLVRGRRFLHPKLGLTFTAPEGFVLDNSPSAVIGVLPGRGLAIRFDSMPAFTGQPEDALRQGWIDGVSLGEIESLTINGLPAASMVVAGTEWSFRLAAIRLGTATYRFIFAAQRMSPEIDRMFRQSIESFRPLGLEETAAARPLRIRRIVAGPTDTVERFVGMMGVERPQDRFMVLNGLDRPTLQAGRSYKVITE